VRARSATIKPTALITVEVRAVGGGVVYDSDGGEIPGDRFVHVELTPHIAHAIASGDLEKRLRPARRKPTAKTAAAPPKAGGPVPAKKATKPAAKTPAPARRGRKPSPIWEERVAPHFDKIVKDEPFPSLGSARDSVKLWMKGQKLAQFDDRTVERWIKKYRLHWFRGA
jgi:hypothetical protein